MEVRVRVYLEDATRFLEEAEREFREGLRRGDLLRVRDAAEKAWNAVVQASNALLLKLMGKTPSSYWERRKMLRELERVKPELAGMGFRDRYGARERHLHEMVYYEGVVDPEDIEYELKKARDYVEDVKRVLGEMAG